MLRWQPLLFLLLMVNQSLGWAGNQQRAHVRATATAPATDHFPVRRNYLNTSRYLISGHGIVLEGTPRQIIRLSAWLDEIYKVPHGRKTLEAILASGNQVTIRHSLWALQASGRTLAPATSDLTNGRGEDVEILFDARIPEHGSHWVFDSQQQHIEFTAVQNLFHELAHAKHLANGTWRYADSEGQAIEEENIFRQQLSLRQGQEDAPLRAGIAGEQFWQPDNVILAAD